MIPERRTTNFSPERRKSERQQRRERWAAGGVAGFLAGPVAIMGTLVEIGEPPGWKTLVLAILINAGVTLATVCFWDVRWYIAQILRVKFNLPPRRDES